MLQDHRTPGCTYNIFYRLQLLQVSPLAHLPWWLITLPLIKLPTDPGLASERQTACSLLVLQRSLEAKKLHTDELHPRNSHELRGCHHHSSSTEIIYEINYLLKSSRQTLLYNQNKKKICFTI